MPKPYTVASLFAGIGGICLGFKQAGAEIVWANEIDKSACETYNSFFNNPDYLHQGDIYKMDVPDNVKVDIVAKISNTRLVLKVVNGVTSGVVKLVNTEGTGVSDAKFNCSFAVPEIAASVWSPFSNSWPLPRTFTVAPDGSDAAADPISSQPFTRSYVPAKVGVEFSVQIRSPIRVKVSVPRPASPPVQLPA